MTSTAVPGTDRSEFRNVLAGGTVVGVITGVSVVAFIALTRILPGGTMRSILESVLVLVAGVLVSLLPGQRVAARGVEGVAGAAAVGLWGTVVFMAIDIIVLRPFKAYPWTWDAIGGGSTWWYLPIWWMLGTFLAWMGGLWTAARSARDGGTGSLPGLAVPVVVVGLVIAAASKLLGCPAPLAVQTGAGYVLALTAFAVVSNARKA
jgi:hypothetical protein